MSDSHAPNVQFLITAQAKIDLNECAEEDGWAARYIARFLREFRSRADLIDAVLLNAANDGQVHSITELWKLQNRRINGYRLSFFQLRKWRLIFIVDKGHRRLGLFAIMHRDENYSDDLMARIEREFDELGFSRY